MPLDFPLFTARRWAWQRLGIDGLILFFWAFLAGVDFSAIALRVVGLHCIDYKLILFCMLRTLRWATGLCLVV